MRTTSSVSFVCRKSKQTKKGVAPIEMGITINGVRKFFNLPRKENPKTFEKESGKRGTELFDYLNTFERNVNTAMTELMEKGIPITAERIREYVRYGGIKSYTLNDLFNEYFKILGQRVGTSLTAGVMKKYQHVREMFFAVFSPDMEAVKLNYGDILNIKTKWYSEYKESTAGGYLTKLKTIILYGFATGHLKSNPFVEIKIEKGTPNVEYLTEQELSLLDRDFGNDRLNKVRDLCLFQAYGGGLSYADLATLTKEEIIEVNGTHLIKGKRQKTGIEFSTVILPKAYDILLKYDFHLPIISNQRYNGYLKEIQTLAGITKTLHTHLFRKTYATLLINKGVSINTISKCMGHSNSIITSKIYAHTLIDTIANEVISKVK